MKIPEEVAEKWIRHYLLPYAENDAGLTHELRFLIAMLKECIEQDRAEQRRMCSDAAFYFVSDYECIDYTRAMGVYEACLNAGVEE